MEDAHIAVVNAASGYSIFGVLDGHGGSEVSQYVRDYFPSYIKNSSYLKNKQWKELMTTSFANIDYDISQDKAQKDLVAYFKKASHDEFMPLSENDVYKRVGCTACICLVTDSEIICANAGDSRCVIGKKGTAVEMSMDHKPELESERQRILSAGGTVEDNRVNGVLNLSRSLGDFEYKLNTNLKPDKQLIISVPDIRIEKITKEVDFMVIACDGIWECWDSQKVVDFVYSKLNASAKLSQIIEELFDKIISPSPESSPFGCDNMSCMIVQFKK